MKRRALELLCCVIVVNICVSCWLFPQSMSSRYEILPQKPDGFAVSKRVLLVADNQLNHLYGEPIWLRNQLFDHVINVTIRPVQQDLYGQDILAWILRYYGRHIPIIHLGDGTNLACTGEFERFCEIMDSAAQPWVMTPGNHDAYLLGNLHTEQEDWWRQACMRSQGPMTKDRFIQAYLRHLQEQHPDFGRFYQAHPEQGQWRSNEGRQTFLRAVAWKVDRSRPYRSFVVQELDLSREDADLPVSALLLDSTQFDTAPTLLPQPPFSCNAGVNGSMLSDQLALARQWLEGGAAAGRMTILMVHHPFAALIKSCRNTIDDWRSKYRIPLYVSGHTHHGEYYVRGGDNGWLELNIGSTVDWPIEFRTFEIHEIKEDPDHWVFRTPLFRIPEIWERASGERKPTCDPEQWEIKETEARDFYLGHNYKFSLSPEKTQKELLTALLRTQQRMITAIPSAADNTVWPDHCTNDGDVLRAIDTVLGSNDMGALTSLLISLEAFVEGRTVSDPVALRDYRLCQALWASKYDSLNGRKPVISDPYIQFPKQGE